MTFDDVIGQEHVKSRLQQMIADGQVPHALLFCGPSGCGKLSLAVAMAGQLCPSPLDIHFTYPVIRTPNMSADHRAVSEDFSEEWNNLTKDGYYFSINDWLREMGATTQQAIITVGESETLIRKLSLRPSVGKHKVSIIWLPERMNGECANKLLKLLEEPPMGTIFLLVCEEPEHLLETILSRTQRIDIKKLKTEDISQALTARCGLAEDDAHNIARIATGSWLKAMQMLDTENENSQFLDLFMLLMRMAYIKHTRELKKWSDEVAGFGREKQIRLLAYMQRMIRENFMFNFHQPELNYMTSQEADFATRFARFINERNIVKINSLLDICQRDIAQNANSKIVFYDMALQMIILLTNPEKAI
ncbi:MAG: AAA family ATPase [Prevotella sp.]|nr:AAA family ATPase [Prevotella sp.]